MKSPTTTIRKLSDPELADEAGRLHDALEAVKGEAIRRGLKRVETALWRLTLTPPGESARTDKPMLLRTLGITAAEFAARFTRVTRTDWRMTLTRCRVFRTAA